MLTYPRFAKACYAFFAVAVLAAILKLSVSGAEPARLKMLPTASTATAVELAKSPPEGPEAPRLGSFSDDGEAERLEAVLARADVRKNVSRTVPRQDDLEAPEDDSDGPSESASVFRRPSLDRGSSSEPVCGDLGAAPRSSRVVFPLSEEYFDSYDDTWGAARPQGGHEGSDLMSPAGTPEFALTDGKLVAVAGSNENGWNRLGGYTVMLEAAYDIGPIKKGDLFYYAHLDHESSLPIGTRVRAGQRIGTAGDTGEGPEVTRGKFPSHLHLGWYDTNLSEERSEAESGAMNPYPLLLWLERNGGAVSGGADASYCQAPQSPNPAPSTGEPDWPTPSAPGERPDLDTGEGGDASPAAREKHRHDHPKRDRNDGNRSGEKENGQETVTDGRSETQKVEKLRDEEKKLSLRKKPKSDAPLRDLPSGAFDRNVPEERSDDGRKDGGQNDEVQDEEPQKTDRPNGDRPKGQQDAPPEDAPKVPAPVAVPERQSRPVPEKPGDEKAEAAEEEPEVEMPLNAVPEGPAKKPFLVPPAGEGTVGDVPLPRKEAVPAPDGIVDALEVENAVGPETDEGE